MIWTTMKIGWRILRGVQARIDRANLNLVAAGGAFFAMLSVFPGLAAVITLLGFVADPSVVEDQLDLISEFVPTDAFTIIEEQVRRMVQTNSSTLGWATLISTLATLWSARKGTDALIRGLNAIYYGPSRNGVYAAVLSFGMTLALSLMTVVALLSLVVVPLGARILNLPFLAETLPPDILAWANGMFLFTARWLIALTVVFVSVWMLYRFAPNVPRRRTGVFTIGAVLSVIIWGGATLGFSYYLRNFGNYSQIYGSIGAVIALLMFLYITIFVVLLGAALNAELEVDHSDPTPTTIDNEDSSDTSIAEAAAITTASIGGAMS